MATRENLVALMRTSNRTHVIAARILYRNVDVSGRSARLFFATISTPTPTSLLYAHFVRTLRFGSTVFEDVTLTFPMLCEALLRVRDLRSLVFNITSTPSEFLARLMERRGIIRRTSTPFASLDLSTIKNPSSTPFSLHTLPTLHALCVEKDLDLLAIANFRRITDATILPVLSYDGLIKVVKLLDTPQTVGSLRTLIIRLDHHVDLWWTLCLLSETFTQVTTLSVEYRGASAMVSLTRLRYTHKV